MTNKINPEELVNAAGGNDGNENSGFTSGIVYGVAGFYLSLREAPDGNGIIDGGKFITWQNGESIQIQPSSKTGHWIKAVKGNFVGWVDANHVWY